MNEPSPKIRRNGTILIVDDEPNVLWFISKTCQPKGYATLTAGSGMEALKVIQECGDKLDLILLDLRMPGMGGIEVLKSIKKHHPELPVIIITAVHDKREECEKLGIEAFLKKPYSLEDLYAKIEAVMEKQILEKGEVTIAPDMEPYAKLLIVDDEREVCEILSEALSEDILKAAFTVKWVTSGDEALRESLKFQPDLAIVDIKMPHMWGDELVKRFKAGEGHCPKDFIIYTSVTDPKEIDRARKLGHRLLTKPTDLDVLVDCLKKSCVKYGLLRKKT